MTDKRITDLPELTSPVVNDYLVAVDVSDTTSSAEGTTKKMSIESLFNSSNFFGWANYSDAQYTEASPLAVLSGVRTLITNNAGSSLTETTYINESSPLWDNDAITPVAVGDAYDVRLVFKCVPASNDQDITLELDIGEPGVSSIPIYAETKRMLKGSGQENNFAFSIPVFCLDTFLANGGRFYITPSSNIDFYGCGVLIVKTYRNLEQV